MQKSHLTTVLNVNEIHSRRLKRLPVGSHQKSESHNAFRKFVGVLRKAASEKQKDLANSFGEVPIASGQWASRPQQRTNTSMP
jgi:hypothetical protein